MMRSFIFLGFARKALYYALGFIAFIAAPAAHAQANLSFSGGSGTPLTLSLTAPVSYTITTANAAGPYFFFQSVGNPFGGNGSNDTVTGNITYTVNGGIARNITQFAGGFNVGSITPNDFFLEGQLAGVHVNDIVTLTSGTVTTTANLPGAAPASGSFTTFVSDVFGTRNSTNGVAGASAPEPGSFALVFVSLPSLSAVVARRCKRAA